jgi:hypothetical protein
MLSTFSKKESPKIPKRAALTTWDINGAFLHMPGFLAEKRSLLLKLPIALSL